MMAFIYLILSLAFSPVPQETACLSAEEKKLFEMINAYRKAEGLPAIPFSAKLTEVAKAHVLDLTENYAFSRENPCNPHSWSDRGDWTPCCYTSDHSQAGCMWAKPREIAGYPGEGYEIAYIDSEGANAERGLAGWKESPAHNPLLLNQDIWEPVTWKAMGLAIHGEYAVVWFGRREDSSRMVLCD